MSENKDPSIKLFGKTIQLGSNFDDDSSIISSKIVPLTAVSATKHYLDFDSESTSSDHNFPCSKHTQNRVNEEPTSEELMDAEQGERSSESALEEPKTPTSKSTKEENLNTPTKEMSQDLSKNDHDQNDQASSNSESSDQNLLKKPDKIIPCARCSSMDTKFCYFNNYNVNQPRHFCKNCQRYWTAGGSMRNVPVGAGRRKSKNSTASHPRQLVIPGASYGLIHHVMRPDGTVFAFGVDDTNSNQSKVSTMKLGEGSPSFLQNGHFRSENEKKGSSSNSISIEKNGDCTGGTDSSQVVPCFSYGWNPIPQQTAFPMPFYSGSTSQWGENLTAPWNLNWVPTPLLNSDQSSSNSSPNNSPLGKHSREFLTLMPSKSDNKESVKEDSQSPRVVIPKTLRIDDPSEAAKSSIWTTLGIKHDHIGSSSGRVAFFGGLQHAKGVPYERRNINQNVETSSMVLQANPAAFSRSLSFHEIAQ